MITLSGALTVHTIKGRYGAFNVGTLTTEIGQFSIKDHTIEELDEGKYSGNFTIAFIKSGHYIAQNRLVVEVRATLAEIDLQNSEQLSSDEDFPLKEQDPIEEERLEAAAPKAQKTADVEPVEAKVPASEDDELAALFGQLLPLGDQVKLEPEVGRPLLRKQAAWLKEHGYQYRFKEKVWLRRSANQT